MIFSLAIRADANERIGAGHIMRCLALAQAWEGPVTFCCLQPPAWIGRRLAAEGLALRSLEDDLEDTRAMAAEVDWMLVDGYHFTPAYLRALGGRVAFFDDIPRLSEYPVELVWNPNLGADPAPYEPCRALTGPAFYPLRREFWPYQGRELEQPEQATRLLITMGGADPAHFTGTALQALRGSPFSIRVIVGGSNPDLSHLEPFRSERVELRTNVQNMAAELSWAELALSAGGVTSYELAFLGVPAVLVVLADNQEASVRGFLERQAAWSLGPAEEVRPERLVEALERLALDRTERTLLTSRSRQLVDGQGAARVARVMREALQRTST